MIRLHLVLILALVAGPMVAAAQENTRKGIAFVQAAELDPGVCIGKDADTAFACAKERCIANGADAADCEEMAYCFPARFSVQVALHHQEGINWQEFYCGWETRESALKAAQTACDTTDRPYISDCFAFRIYDENGVAEDLP